MFDNNNEQSKEEYEDFELDHDEDIGRFYAVAVWRIRRVSREWNKCYNSTNKYTCALFKAFSTKEQADQFLVLQKYKNTEKDIVSTGSLNPHQKTRPLFSSVARILISSPTTSKSSRSTSRSTRRKKAPFNKLTIKSEDRRRRQLLIWYFNKFSYFQPTSNMSYCKSS